MMNPILKTDVGYRPTWAEVSLDNITYNFLKVKECLCPETKVLVTVKADAYGHGLIPVSRQLVAAGVDFLGVASIDEGIKLRLDGIRVPILILGLVMPEDINPVFEYNLTCTVCDEDFAAVLNKQARARGVTANVHIKVDTGMGRIGVMAQDAQTLVEKVARLKHVRVEGLFTHFAFADLNKDFTLYQIRLFKELVGRLKERGISVPLVHSANSMGVISYKESHCTMVRPGLIVYGLYPASGLPVRLKPVLSLKTHVVYIKAVPRGCGISYGHEYITRADTRIATLPIGYGDGYPRNLSNKAPVLIKGKRFTVCGRICMDQMMVDIGKTPVKVGDEVVLIGRQGSAKVTAEELAALSGTIPYEIVCGLGSRIPRIYY